MDSSTLSKPTELGKRLAMLRTFLDALDHSEPRPAQHAKATAKKNYAQRLSEGVATIVANALRTAFPTILPDAEGRQQESRARTAKGLKNLDVNYSTLELGLGLGVSIKTLNYPDGKSGRYTKNYTRNDNELRAEAKDYHQRQPYSVLVAIVFLPLDSCEDGAGAAPSSFGAAVRAFRHRANRTNPKNEQELFERVFVGLYEHNGPDRGEVFFVDVMDAPPRHGRPVAPKNRVLTFQDVVDEIVSCYDCRNNPPFRWSE